jgi:16S rRNA (guanine966-N2)-methyltransferase
MRVIAGSLGGRRFNADIGARTHPTAERVRGALFNSLGDISGYTILDAFAGTGAYAYEAASRGAGSVLAIERDPKAQRVIAQNIQQLELGDIIHLAKTSCSTWSDNNPHQQFDIVICDVPYDDLQLSTVSKLIRHVKPNGLMVLSYPGRESVPTVNGVVVVDNKSYGDAALAYYRKETAQ